MITRTSACEFRAKEDEPVIEGYFAVFGEIYEMTDKIRERIHPHAFDDTVANDDIRALINHDTAMVLGRNVAGTLKLRPDEHGLWGRITVNTDDTDAKNILARVRRRDVTQCSIGFDILDEQQEKQDGAMLFTVKRVKLWEVSVVTFPAYETTEVEARARLERARNTDARLFAAWQDEMKGRMDKWH